MNFYTGPDVAAGYLPGWEIGTSSVASNGSVTITSLLDSSGGTSSTALLGGTLNEAISANGTITESGPAFSGGTMKMSSNKQLVVGVTSLGNNRLLRIWVKQTGSFSNADLTGPFNYVSSRINSGTSTNWAFEQGTISSGIQTSTSLLYPTGPATPLAPGGPIQTDANGILTYQGSPNWHGIMTPDKKLIFRVNTIGTNNYSFGVISILGQTFSQGDVMGLYTELAIDNSPVWEYSTGFMFPNGVISATTFLDSTGNTSLASGSGTGLTISPSGLICISSNTSTNGFMSYNKNLVVFTSTWQPGGEFAMTLVLPGR